MLGKRMVILYAGLIVGFCFFGFSPSLSQAEVTLTVGDGSGSPGSTDNPVVVSLANPDDAVGGIQMDICEDKDDYLTPPVINVGPPPEYDDECAPTDRAAGFDCLVNELPNGCCRVLLVSVAGSFVEEGEGPVFTLKYDVSGEAPAEECRELNPEGVMISGENENQQLSDVILESGTFCFSASSTTTTTIATTTTTATTTPSIGVSPDPMWKSRWVSLPYLLVIEGTGTQFNYFQTRLSFEPSGVVFPFFPIIWNELYIWDIVWVMPGWLAGLEDQTVTVTVTTEDREVSNDCVIKLLPFILGQERSRQ